MAYLAFVEASGNAKDGFQASEGSEDYPAAIADDQNAGDLRVRVAFSKFKNNLDGAGIKVDQVGPGVGLLWLLFADFGGNFDGPVDADGVDVFGL